MKDKIITVDDVSKSLNIAKSTVYSYVNQSKIPHIKLEGKILFVEKELDSWIDSKKVPVSK
ncbi:MAG: helix-turn-helix domain-containing protein [Prevotella sp.]|jgi:excisionase family DNA binding protein|nr:helix-turn-helix domain-containing protein [Prevotella sp.]